MFSLKSSLYYFTLPVAYLMVHFMFYSYFFFTFCLFFYTLWQIGAVNGSEEFKLGVTMNADMKGITYASVIYSDVRTHPCDVNEAKRKSVRQLRKSLN